MINYHTVFLVYLNEETSYNKKMYTKHQHIIEDLVHCHLFFSKKEFPFFSFE